MTGVAVNQLLKWVQVQIIVCAEASLSSSFELLSFKPALKYVCMWSTGHIEMHTLIFIIICIDHRLYINMDDMTALFHCEAKTIKSPPGGWLPRWKQSLYTVCGINPVRIIILPSQGCRTITILICRSTYIPLLIQFVGIHNADKYLQVSFGDGFLFYPELEVLHFPVKHCEMWHRG